MDNVTTYLGHKIKTAHVSQGGFSLAVDGKLDYTVIGPDTILTRFAGEQDAIDYGKQKVRALKKS